MEESYSLTLEIGKKENKLEEVEEDSML